MSRHSKAPAGWGMTEASQHKKHQLKTSDNKRTPIVQPGTALTAFLKKYKFDLLLLPCDRHISSLVDCCDFILDEVERS